MATHAIPLAHADQDVRKQWRTGALRGIAGDEVEEARRRQQRENIQILDVLGQFCHGTDQGSLPMGWFSINRQLHSRDIYERLCNLPRGTLASLTPSHDAYGQPVLALQVTYPREALLPAVDFLTPADNRTLTSGSSFAYIPPVPEGQEHARFPFREVEVSTLTRRYKWAIARTHRLSPMLFTLAMSEVLRVPVNTVSITQVKRENTTGAACPYELFCVICDPAMGMGTIHCPICASSGPLERSHMDQDSHRF